MASRRRLKKYVNYISGELFLEGFIRYWKMPAGEDKGADEFLSEVMMLQSEFISRISHTEAGNVKGYYRKFHEDFRARVTAMEEKLNQW
jgi:hypothetical protein